MAKKVKSKKAPAGRGHHPRKKGAKREKKARPHVKKTAHKPVARTKPLIAHEPKPVTPTRTLFARKAKPPREFVVTAAPATGAALPIKKKKKKPQMVLRFTENTLKDIAALECVRRCFR